MKNLEEYLLENIEKGFTYHTLKSKIDNDGNISFYIHATSQDSDTLDYFVKDNKLIPKNDFKYENE